MIFSANLNKAKLAPILLKRDFQNVVCRFLSLYYQRYKEFCKGFNLLNKTKIVLS